MRLASHLRGGARLAKDLQQHRANSGPLVPSDLLRRMLDRFLLRLGMEKRYVQFLRQHSRQHALEDVQHAVDLPWMSYGQ